MAEKGEKQVDAVKVEQVDFSIEDSASMFSRCFLFYLNPLFKLGAERTLMHEDLGLPSKFDRSAILFEDFDRRWKKECVKPIPKRSLWNVLLGTVGFWRFTVSIILYAIYAGSGFGPILIMNALVRHFDGLKTLSASTVWIFVALLFIIPMMGYVIDSSIFI